MGRNGRSARDEGVPVWKALEQLAPEELCQRYKQIVCYEKYQIFILGNGKPIDPRYREVADLKRQLMKILFERLQGDDLVASGIESPPRDLRNPRQDIAPDLWPLLDLDLINSEAEGQGLKFVALRIHGLTRPEPRHDIGSSMGAQDETVRQRRGGPSTIMPLVQAAMAARAARGELLPTLAATRTTTLGWTRATGGEVRAAPDRSVVRDEPRHGETTAVRREASNA